MEEKYKNKLFEFISNGKIEEAIKATREVAEDDVQTLQSLLILQSRYNQIKDMWYSQVIARSEYDISISQITATLLDIIQDLSAKEESRKILLGKKVNFHKILKDNVLLVSGILLLMSTLTYILFENQMYASYFMFSEHFGFPVSDTIKVIILLSALIFSFKFLYNYLNSANTSTVQQEFSIPTFKVEDIAKNIVLLDEKSKKELLEKVNSQLTAEVIDTFKNSVEEKLKKDIRYEKLIDNFSKIEIRILEEIKSLNRKANINLSIGVLTTILAIMFLVYISLSFQEKYDSWLNFVSHYIPRLTLVVFIEVFSFYFLKLYRTNLNEIQYYQNEMTSIEFKIISLKTALLSNDEENLKYIINEFVKLDYNKVLKKDETTIEIERNRAENEYSKVVLERIFDHFNINTVLGSNHKTIEKDAEPNK